MSYDDHVATMSNVRIVNLVLPTCLDGTTASSVY